MQKFWFNVSLYYDKSYAYRISHHTLQMTNTKINSSESTGSQKQMTFATKINENAGRCQNHLLSQAAVYAMV